MAYNIGVLYFNQLAFLVTPFDAVVQQKYDKNISPKLSDQAKVQAIYRYVNSFAYVIDRNDVWQTPAETIHLRSGDCEDFVALTSSLLFNIPIMNYMVIFKGENWPQYHIVNMVFLNNKPVILDTTLRHDLFALPNYSHNPVVYSFFSPLQPVSNPINILMPVPLNDFLTDSTIVFQKILNLQI